MKLNLAQQLYVLLGVEVSRLKLFGGKRPSLTKKGPGRYHPKNAREAFRP